MPVAPLACHTVARTEVNFDFGVRYVHVAWVGVGKKREVNKRRPRLRHRPRQVRGVAKEIGARASIRENTVYISYIFILDMYNLRVQVWHLALHQLNAGQTCKNYFGVR